MGQNTKACHTQMAAEYLCMDGCQTKLDESRSHSLSSEVLFEAIVRLWNLVGSHKKIKKKQKQTDQNRAHTRRDTV